MGNGIHSSVPAWRIPGTGEPGGLPSMGSHRVGRDWSDLAAAVKISCKKSGRRKGERCHLHIYLPSSHLRWSISSQLNIRYCDNSVSILLTICFTPHLLWRVKTFQSTLRKQFDFFPQQNAQPISTTRPLVKVQNCDRDRNQVLPYKRCRRQKKNTNQSYTHLQRIQNKIKSKCPSERMETCVCMLGP